MSDPAGDVPWGTAEVLAHVSLVAEGASYRRGGGRGAWELARVALRRPVVYQVLRDELAEPFRRRADDGSVQFVGVIFAAELDELRRGHACGSLCLTVSLPAGHRAVELPADPSADASASGLYAQEFSWTFEAPGGNRPLERTFVACAVVEAPAEVVDLTGELSCQALVRRSMPRYVRTVSATVEKTVPFAERINGLRPAPVGSERAVRLVVAVDVENYSGRDPGGSKRTQERLATVLDQARSAAESAVEDRQEGGDSVLYVFPPGIDESAVLRRFYAELVSALAAVNVDLSDGAALRLRVGVDRGLTERGGTGWPGQGPITAVRLRDARPARDAFKAAPSAHLVLTVSDILYRDVFSERGPHPAAESFKRVEVNVPEKGFSATAWVHVPEPGSRR